MSFVYSDLKSNQLKTQIIVYVLSLGIDLKDRTYSKNFIKFFSQIAFLCVTFSIIPAISLSEIYFLSDSIPYVYE